MMSSSKWASHQKGRTLSSKSSWNLQTKLTNMDEEKSKMDEKIELLAMSMPLSEILADHDIETTTVIEWLLDEGLISLDTYFDEEEDE